MRLDARTHLPVQTEMSSARQSLGRLNDALSFIPTVMTTSLATAPGTEATGVPAARMAQIEQILEDALDDAAEAPTVGLPFGSLFPTLLVFAPKTVNFTCTARMAPPEMAQNGVIEQRLRAAVRCANWQAARLQLGAAAPTAWLQQRSLAVHACARSRQVTLLV